jgi:hypothetical protein
LLVFGVFSTKIVDHGGHHSNVMRALDQWWHPVASIEARDVLHWAMRIAPFCHGVMAIKIIVNLPAYFVSLIVDFIVGQNHKLKTMSLPILNKYELPICSFVCYQPICIIWAPAVNDGCRVGHHFQWRARNSSKTQIQVKLN